MKQRKKTGSNIQSEEKEREAWVSQLESAFWRFWIQYLLLSSPPVHKSYMGGLSFGATGMWPVWRPRCAECEVPIEEGECVWTACGQGPHQSGISCILRAYPMQARSTWPVIVIDRSEYYLVFCEGCVAILTRVFVWFGFCTLRLFWCNIG